MWERGNQTVWTMPNVFAVGPDGKVAEVAPRWKSCGSFTTLTSCFRDTVSNRVTAPVCCTHLTESFRLSFVVRFPANYLVLSHSLFGFRNIFFLLFNKSEVRLIFRIPGSPPKPSMFVVTLVPVRLPSRGASYYNGREDHAISDARAISAPLFRLCLWDFLYPSDSGTKSIHSCRRSG
jgi:hypothetical protein